MAMAERQAAHRQEMEPRAVIGASKRSYLGLGAAFLLSAITVGAGTFLTATGHDLAGGSVIGINLVSLAAVFVYGSRNRALEQRPQDSQPPIANGERSIHHARPETSPPAHI